MHPSESSAGQAPGPPRPAAMSSSKPLTILKDVALRTRNQTLMQRRTTSARSRPETSPVETAPNRCSVAGKGLTGSPPSPAKVGPLFLPIAPVGRAALWLPGGIHAAPGHSPDAPTRQVHHEQPRLNERNMLIMAESMWVFG